MIDDLFRDAARPMPIGPGACILPAFAAAREADLLDALTAVLALAPLRRMQTPGGYTMTVAMSGCGAQGWISDEQGYRYSPIDPLSARRWPAMPGLFAAIARDAAERAGYADFVPDACLINRYLAGAKLSPHQDRDERDLSQPIVSLSLGLPAVFLFGGTTRRVRLRQTTLQSGDVVVWGGPSRLAYHGVRPLAAGRHPLTGECRYNLSFRRAL